MDVVSLSPLRVTGLVWRPSSGAYALTVICKGTYDLRPGELRFAEDQDDPNEEDNHWDDDPNRSVRAPSDLCPFKLRADVVLVGQAFAPNQMPVRSLRARLAVAGVDKAIEVHGDRIRTQEGLREASFTTMHLRYERAAAAPENPVGVRVDARATGPLPNLQLPGRGLEVACFGPIAPSWPSRRARLGRHAGSFPPARWADAPMPEDLDATFFNVAPADQQPARLDPGERVVLENLSPKHATLVAELPRSRIRAFVDRGGGLEEVSLACDTLWIDTDRATCTITWRGQIGLHGPADEGRVSVLVDSPARPLSWAEIQEKCVVRRAEVEDPRTSLEEGIAHGTREYRIQGGEIVRTDDALPFVHNPPDASAPRSQVTRPPWMEAAPRPAAPIDDMNQTVAPGALRVSPRWLDPAPPRAPDPPVVNVPPPPALTVGQAVAPPLTIGQSAPLTVGQTAQPPLTVGQIAAPPPVRLEPSAIESLTHLPASAALAASNLAADPEPLADAGKDRARGAAAEIVDLLWFDPSLPDRVRVDPAWRETVAKLRPVPDEPDDDDPPLDPPEVIDRQDVFAVLTDGEPTAAEDLDARVAEATSPRGVYTPPLVAIRAEIELAFDDLETLKASLAVVAPFTGGADKRLKDAFDAGSAAISSWTLGGTSRALENLRTRIAEAFAAGSWSLPAGYLEQQVERTLVEQRKYERRSVLGATWIRALVGPRPARVPVYLPEALATKLPLYARFPARVIAEVHLQQDAYETHASALRCLAIARVTPARPRQATDSRATFASRPSR